VEKLDFGKKKKARKHEGRRPDRGLKKRKTLHLFKGEEDDAVQSRRSRTEHLTGD